MEAIEKEKIANTCENVYKYCVSVIPQVDNNKLIWFLNGSTLCNILYNVKTINDVLVSLEFNNSAKAFVRKPKGDLDITYTANQRYQFDLENEYIKAYQSISDEQRTEHFVDHNDELKEFDLKQICKMTTKSGFTFYAKKPQYLFLYKLREFIAIFNQKILNNNLEEINIKKKNILSDVINLYNISIAYCGYNETMNVLNELPNISDYLHDLYHTNKQDYDMLLNKVINLLNNEEQKLSM